MQRMRRTTPQLQSTRNTLAKPTPRKIPRTEQPQRHQRQKTRRHKPHPTLEKPGDSLKMKILNLYAGIGGNTHNLDRNKHNVTHVEINEEIADVTTKLHPKDNVIIGDAKKHLQKNYQEYDYIWASPPCPSHSSIRKAGTKKGQYDALIPDMDLYGVIIFLDEYFDGHWTVENVQPFYERLDKQEKERQKALQKIIPPAQKSNRHLFWSNHEVPELNISKSGFHQKSNSDLMDWLGIYITETFDTVEKRKVLRNCVHPKIGKSILDARKTKQTTLEVKA